MRVLIAEDEEGLARGLKYLLEKQKLSADVVFNGNDALDFFHTYEYDAVVLDIMMPGKNGIEVLEQIRNESSAIPVMMLTAKSEVEDRVLGLSMGADDYLPKPFATAEFVARVKALLRRSAAVFSEDRLSLGNVTLDRNRYELLCGDNILNLNNKEFQLMELFLMHPRRVFSTEMLMDRVWGAESESNIDVVWTYIGVLRKKMKGIGANVELKTVRGAGYALRETEAAAPEKSACE